MQYEKEELTAAVKEFISIMKENDLGHLCVKNDKFEIELGEKRPMPPMPPMPQMPVFPAQAVQPPKSEPAAAAEKPGGKYIKAPIVGTFYAASAPGKEPYAKPGKSISKGDVVFIIESMKLMNEVKSEISGVVAEILVSDGEAVEYDQPIIRLE